MAEPKVGFVLGSGAAIGRSHIGVIKVLRDHKIPIHVTARTSAGAVIGAFLTANAIENLERFALGHKSLKDTFSYIDINLISFSEIHIDDGFLIPAIRASVAVTGFLTPLESQGIQLVDSGLLNPVPGNLVRQLGADIVISVDLNAHNSNIRVNSFMGILDRTLSVLMNKVREANMEKFPADVAITPDLSHYKFMDYHKTGEAIQVGYDSALEKIPEIKKILKSPISKYKKAAFFLFTKYYCYRKFFVYGNAR